MFKTTSVVYNSDWQLQATGSIKLNAIKNDWHPTNATT